MTPFDPGAMKNGLLLSSKAFTDHKFAHYAYLREHDPVHRGKVMRLMGATFLARHEDCTAVLRDPRFVRNRTTATGGRRFPFPMPKSVEALANSMISEDEPDHRRLRSLVHKAFTPRRLQALEARVETLTHELLDRLEPKKRIELLQHYAHPIPVTIIAEMVGVRVDEVPRFAGYINAITKGFSGFAIARTLMLDLPKAARFVRGLIARKRQYPADDILSGLIEAEEEGDRLTEDELVAMVFLIIVAGHETTYNLITNAVRALLLHPVQLERLRADPSLMDPAIEEVLRFEGPLHGTKPEYPTEDVEIRGVTIRRGTLVMPLLGSANRDEAVFEDPDVFDIGRTPNKHLGFGQGVHYCLGAPLARMETRIALRSLLDRNPNLALAVDPGELELLVRPGWHVYRSLPVTFG